MIKRPTDDKVADSLIGECWPPDSEDELNDHVYSAREFARAIAEKTCAQAKTVVWHAEYAQSVTSSAFRAYLTDINAEHDTLAGEMRVHAEQVAKLAQVIIDAKDAIEELAIAEAKRIKKLEEEDLATPGVVALAISEAETKIAALYGQYASGIEECKAQIASHGTVLELGCTS